MLKYFFTLSILIGISSVQAQDTLEVYEEEYEIFLNEVGIGPLLFLPSGILKTHNSKAQPGISLNYLRNIQAGVKANHYLGIELNWIDMQTVKEDIIAFDPDGEYEYTSIADMEYASLTLLYRLQPDLAFLLWPYVELGFGPAYFYTMDRDRYPTGDDEYEEEYNLVSGHWTTSSRFGMGLQYFIPDINAFVDLAWRYSFHGRTEYDIIDEDELPDGVRPVTGIEKRTSRANNQMIKLTFNLLF